MKNVKPLAQRVRLQCQREKIIPADAISGFKSQANRLVTTHNIHLVHQPGIAARLTGNWRLSHHLRHGSLLDKRLLQSDQPPLCPVLFSSQANRYGNSRLSKRWVSQSTTVCLDSASPRS